MDELEVRFGKLAVGYYFDMMCKINACTQCFEWGWVSNGKDMTYGERSADQLVVKLRLADDHMEIK